MLHDIFAFRPEHRPQPLLTALLEQTDGERRVTNLRHLAELLHEAVRERHLGIQGLFRWFGRQMAREKPPSEAFELRLESDGRAVKLVTIHKAKGLEYPVVYVPYAWHGVPAPRTMKLIRYSLPCSSWKSECVGMIASQIPTGQLWM